MAKLTLSMDDDVVTAAKRLARRHRTSVSAMLAGMVKAMAVQEQSRAAIPADSAAARLTGIIKAPAERSDRDLLTDALLERHGIGTP